jgi:flagellar hook-length control protein FliK
VNEPNIDSLLKLTAPRPDWKTAAAPGDRQLLPAFSDQLWQLTAPPAPERLARPRYAADPPSRSNASDPWSSSRVSVDEQPSSQDQSHRETASTSSSATSDDAQASANTSLPPVNQQQESAVEGDTEPEEQSEPSDAADESGAAEVAGGLSKSPAASDVPANQACGEAEKTAVTKGVENAATADKAATDASKISEAIDPAATPAVEIAARDPAAVTDSPPQADEHPQNLPSATGSSVNVALAAADVQAADTDANAAPAATGAASEIGEGGSKKGVVRQRPAKTSLGPKKSDAPPSTPGIEKQANAETPSVDAPLAVHIANASAEINEHGDASDSSVDERPRAHGKESSARTAPRSGPTPVVANASASGSSNETSNRVGAAASTEDAAAKPVRSAAVRADGLPTTLARGQRGGRAGQSPELQESATLNRVDTARFVGRVTRAFHFAQERGGTLQLRLSPPELGSLRIELTVKEGALSASLETETPAARRLLLDHLPALRERLAEQNVRVERFDVDVRRDGQGGRDSQSGQGGQPDASPQQQAQQERRAQQNTPSRQRAQQTAAEEAAAAERAKPIAASSTGINLVI